MGDSAEAGVALAENSAPGLGGAHPSSSGCPPSQMLNTALWVVSSFPKAGWLSLGVCVCVCVPSFCLVLKEEEVFGSFYPGLLACSVKIFEFVPGRRMNAWHHTCGQTWNSMPWPGSCSPGVGGKGEAPSIQSD